MNGLSPRRSRANSLTKQISDTGPPRDEIAILQYIVDEAPVTEKQLIRHGRQVVDRFKRNAEEKGIQITDDPQMGEFRLLDTHILDPLVDRECVKVTAVERRKEITITEEKRNTLRAFDYLLKE